MLGIGQAVGMAAALCVEQQCQPRQLQPDVLQTALLRDPQAPAGVIPLLNQSPDDRDWADWQTYYLQHPESYPSDGEAPSVVRNTTEQSPKAAHPEDTVWLQGTFYQLANQQYELQLNGHRWQLITLNAMVNDRLMVYPNAQQIELLGQPNHAGNWILVRQIQDLGHC